MVAANSKFARLKKEQINKLQALEKELGKVIIAYETVGPAPYAQLTDEQLRQIEQLEQQLGVLLVAYKK